MKKGLYYLLAVSFILTCLAPLTGVKIHKMASCVFLLMCLVHTAVSAKRPGAKTWGMLLCVLLCFASGIAGMLVSSIPLILALHKVLSMVLIFILAIHMFVYRRKMLPEARKR